MKSWMFPGGSIARHESPDEAVTREIREEIGLSISQIYYQS